MVSFCVSLMFDFYVTDVNSFFYLTYFYLFWLLPVRLGIVKGSYLRQLQERIYYGWYATAVIQPELNW